MLRGSRHGLLAAVAAVAIAAEPIPSPWSAFAPDRAALIYAAPAASGAAGMFGHVLILVHGAAGDVAVAWTANIGDDSIAALAWKGLFGGYDSGCQITPWDEVRRGYQWTERRDLWRYDLQLDAAELQRLCAAVAAEQGRRHPYFILDDNCASGIATLLDAARPGTLVSAGLSMLAAPLDVVRAAREAGLAAPGVRLNRESQPDGTLVRDPTHDHRCGRVAIRIGHDGDDGYIGLAVRPAWHSALDPSLIIPLGDALNVLAIEARLTEHGRAHLQLIDILAAESLSQRTVGTFGMAWNLRLGSTSERTADHGDTQHAVVACAIGGSLRMTDELLTFALAAADARLVDDLAMPAAGLGGEVGLRGRLGPLTVEVRARALAWGGELDGSEQRVDGGIGFCLGDNLSLEARGGWVKAWGMERTQYEFGVNLFF